MKIKLATLNDVRKNWIRDISLCIKLLKCKLIQILKRSSNLRDYLSHFHWKKLILQMSLFFPFIAILSVRQPTGSNSRSAEKGFFFALLKNGITDVSLFASYCCFIQEARHWLQKKEINLLAQQTICLRTLNEQTLMRKSLCVYGRKFQSSSLGVCYLNEILCAPSFGGGLHQRFTFFSAVHMWNEIDCKRFLQSPLVVMSFWTQWTTVVSRN